MPFFPDQGGGGGSSFVSAPKIWYVSNSGNDAFDGSQFFPFRTIAAAVAACDAGGGGIIRPTALCRSSTTQGAGLWLRGANDPGIGGAGWTTITHSIWFDFSLVQGGTFAFGGSGWLPGGTASEFTDAPLWLAGLTGGSTFTNMSVGSAIVAPAARIGLSSPFAAYNPATTYASGQFVVSASIAYVSLQNSNVGHTPVSSPSFWSAIRAGVADGLAPTLMSLARWSNCYFEHGGIDAGPTIDFGGGFWYFLDQCVFNRYSFGSDELKNCNIRAYNDGSGPTYLTYITNSRLSGMGIRQDGDTQINVATTTGENIQMPLIHLVANAGSGSPRGVYQQVDSADSAVPNIIVNDGTNQIHCIDCESVAGPAWVDRPTQITSLNATGQAGRTGVTVEAYHDGGRRLHAPQMAPYKNIANALQWFTGTYIVGPDGAAAATHTAKAFANNVDYILYDQNNGWDAPSAGDYYAWGCWVNWTGANPTGDGFVVTNAGTGNLIIHLGNPSAGGIPGVHTLGAGQSVVWLGEIPAEVNRWSWYAGWLRIVDAPAGTRLKVSAAPQIAISVAKPWMIHAAGTGLSDAEWASISIQSAPIPNNGEGLTAFSAVPPAPTAGTLPVWPGTKLAFWDATLGAWKYLDIDNGAVRIT